MKAFWASSTGRQDRWMRGGLAAVTALLLWADIGFFTAARAEPVAVANALGANEQRQAQIDAKTIALARASRQRRGDRR
jgi:hypothetical protein